MKGVGGCDGLAERLGALRGGRDDACAPVWIDVLPPEQALAELAGREGSVYELQRARFLAELGRSAEASSLLEGLDELPAGLSAVRERLREALRPEPGGQGAEPPAARLERWLERVNRWRSELRV